MGLFTNLAKVAAVVAGLTGARDVWALDYTYDCGGTNDADIDDNGGPGLWDSEWDSGDKWRFNSASTGRCEPKTDSAATGDHNWGTDNAKRNFLLYGGATWDNLALEADIAVRGDDDAFGLVVRYSSTTSFVLMGCTNNEFVDADNDHVASQTDGCYVIAPTGVNAGTSAASPGWTYANNDTTYRFRIEANGTNIKVFRDGTEIINTTVGVTAAGKIGFWSYSNDDNRFDNVQVYDNIDNDSAFSDTDCNDNNGSYTVNQTWYADCDGDDEHQATNGVSSCGPPTGNAANVCSGGTAPMADGSAWTTTLPAGPTLDCDDNNATINNTLDWWPDCDGDGEYLGGTAVAENVCNAPNRAKACEDFGSGEVPYVNAAPVGNAADCNDREVLYKDAQVWYPDCDGDDEFGATASTATCGPPSGGAANVCNGNTAPPDADGTPWSGTAPTSTAIDCDDNNATYKDTQVWYPDCDGDDEFSATPSGATCGPPTTTAANVCNGNTAPPDADGTPWSGTAPTSTAIDCDDSNATYKDTQVWYPDCDGDDEFSDAPSSATCGPPSGGAANVCTGSGAPVQDGDPWSATIPVGTAIDCDDGLAAFKDTQVWYPDCDGDDEHSTAASGLTCGPPSGGAANVCAGGTAPNPTTPWTGTLPAGAAIDCDDTQAAYKDPQVWYPDCDGDDEHSTSASGLTCGPPTAGAANVCASNTLPPDADGSAWTATLPANTAVDCDDQDAAAKDVLTWYPDCDNDTFEQTPVSNVSTCGIPQAGEFPVGTCADNQAPDGSWTTTLPSPVDCNDNDASTSPLTDWWADCDGDGIFKDTGPSFSDSCVAPTRLQACGTGSGSVPSQRTVGADCNDGNININPSTDWWPDCDGDAEFVGGAAAVSDSCAAPLRAAACGGFGSGALNFVNAAPTGTPVDCDDRDAVAKDLQSWYPDCDNDSYRAIPSTAVNTCGIPQGGEFPAATCSDNQAPDGSWSATLPTSPDCNDNDATLNPTTSWYTDGDNDTFGAGTAIQQCTQPTGRVRNNTDCNDGDATQNPNTSWYTDGDSDTFGAGTAVVQCAQPAGRVKNNTDCNDSNAAVNPNTVWRTDADSDGYGATSATPSSPSCTAPGAGLSPVSGDCNDADAALNPTTDWYADTDLDGYGTDAQSALLTNTCVEPTNLGPVENNNTDCDDTNAGVNPTTEWYTDADEDGFGDEGSAPVLTDVCEPLIDSVAISADDCDDSDETLNPDTAWFKDTDQDGYGTDEVVYQCGSPGATWARVDGDCDDENEVLNPATVWYEDLDGDTWGDAASAPSCVAPGLSWVLDGGDCDETDTDLNPGTEWWVDADEDSYGDDTTDPTAPSCTPPGTGGPWVTNGDDCADDDDNQNPDSVWWADDDGDSYGDSSTPASASSCLPPETGWVQNDDDCDDTKANVNPDSLWAPDRDEDNFGDQGAEPFLGCVPPNSVVKWVVDQTDCDDVPGDKKPAGEVDGALINPLAEELCNRVDDDCDGDTDEEDDSLVDETTDWWPDLDDDGHGDDESAATAFCFGPEGFAPVNDDCDDDDDLSYGGAPELCDLVDNDCDGTADNDIVSVTWYQDLDGDGDGDASVSDFTCVNLGVGWVQSNTDCDDDDDERAGTFAETCDGIDNDCSGFVDDNPVDGEPYFVDSDNDGYGNPTELIQACSLPVGASGNGDDCNDTDADVYPEAIEYCNGIDDNCNFIEDDGAADPTTWYPDGDGDGYGADGDTVQACVAPDGYGEGLEDCDDEDATVNPGAEELCDGLDNDCDGDAENTGDTGLVWETWYTDADSDGFGDPASAAEYCEAPLDAVSQSGDCDDQDAERNPEADEVPGDGIDQDCDGEDEAATSGRVPSEDGGYVDPSEVIPAAVSGCSCDSGSRPGPGAPLFLLFGLLALRRRKSS